MATAVTWSSGASSSTKLFLFMVPLVLVAALVSVLGPSPSTWLSTAKPPVLLLSSVTSSAGTSSGAVTTPSEVKQREELVVLPVDNRAGENLLSDHAHFNLSTTPPFSVQAIQTPQHHVRAFSSFIITIPPLSLPFFFLYMNDITEFRYNSTFLLHNSGFTVINNLSEYLSFLKISSSVGCGSF